MPLPPSPRSLAARSEAARGIRYEAEAPLRLIPLDFRRDLPPKNASDFDADFVEIPGVFGRSSLSSVPHNASVSWSDRFSSTRGMSDAAACSDEVPPTSGAVNARDKPEPPASSALPRIDATMSTQEMISNGDSSARGCDIDTSAGAAAAHAARDDEICAAADTNTSGRGVETLPLPW